MPDEPTPAPGGATGAPATPEAVGSPEADAALLASLDQADKNKGQPDPDADFWKQAAEKDFSKAPADLRAKIEAPFLAISGKKTQEAELQRKFYESVIERLATANNGKPAEPTPDQRTLLRDKIAEGDLSAVDSLVEEIVNQRVGPQMDYINTNRAIAEAAQIVPELPKYEAQVAEALKRDPELLRLASIDNRRYASRVLAAVALQLKAADLEAQLKVAVESGDAKAKQAVESYKRELRGLPPSTSKAGSTPTAFTPDKPMTLDEIKDAAWAAAGGR